MTIYPTVLYIKQHPITGLKYFGKTTAKDPYKYLGSGTDWKLHLKEYGSTHIITTIVFGPCTDSEVISEFALTFSRDNNIVESKDWANCKIENGLDGNSKGSTHSPETRQKMKGRTHSDESKQKISDAKTGQTHSDESKQKISDTLTGIIRGPQSTKHKQNQSNAMIGRSNGPHSEETKRKLRKPKRKVKCPHCGKIGGSNTMQRWHFDNCKFNPSLSIRSLEKTVFDEFHSTLVSFSINGMIYRTN
jgi:hypothetical protein